MSQALNNKKKLNKASEGMKKKSGEICKQVMECDYWTGRSVEALREKCKQIDINVISIAREIILLEREYDTLDQLVEEAERDKQRKIDEARKLAERGRGRNM